MANETFFDILRAGTRLPVELEGDVYSLCACNDAGIRRLVEMMGEFGLDGLDDLAEHIFDASRRATMAAIAALPPGIVPVRDRQRRLRGAGDAAGAR